MKDIYTGIIISVLGIAIYLMARQMQSPIPGFGPEVFPSIIGAMLILLGIILTCMGFMSGKKTSEEEAVQQFWVAPFTVLLTSAYIVSLPSLPFLVVTPIYLLILISMGRFIKMGVWREGITIKLFVFITIVSVMIYSIFKLIFNVALI